MRRLPSPRARAARGLLLLGVSALASAAAAACYLGPTPSQGGPTADTSATDPAEGPAAKGKPGAKGGEQDTEGEAAAAPPPEATGLPCDVDAVLRTKCQTCHGVGSDVLALVTYEDLVAPSNADPSKSNAQLSVERMKATRRQMPPRGAPAATPGDVAALEQWVAKGLPTGTCARVLPDAGSGAGGSTGSGSGASGSGASGSGASGSGASGGATSPAPDGGRADAGPTSVCTSGLTWSSMTLGTRMNPGKACLECHTSFGGPPILQIGGTVYPTRHEPDLCYGVQVPAHVVVKDATGRSVTLSTGATGNFTLSTKVAPLVYPIQVKVVRNGQERAMHSSPPHGDCNKCHQENGFPGRIQAP